MVNFKHSHENSESVTFLVRFMYQLGHFGWKETGTLAQFGLSNKETY